MSDLKTAAQAALDFINFMYGYDQQNKAQPRELVREQLRAALAQPEQSGWIRAVDEAMVCSHLGIANASDDYETAKKKLNDLICWSIDVDRYFEADKRKQPEQSGWVDLTPSERFAAVQWKTDWVDIAEAIESALKAKNANAAPQQTVSVGEINEAWKVFRVWFGKTDWTVADAANYRIIFGHGYNFGAARNTAPVATPQREYGRPMVIGELTKLAEGHSHCFEVPDTLPEGKYEIVLRAALKEKNHG